MDRIKPKLTPKEFADQLDQLKSALQSRIEAEVDGLPTGKVLTKARRDKALDPKGGFEFFCRTYFPHYIKSAPSLLHQHLFADLPAMLEADASASRKGHHKIKIAPRGGAKSTLATQLFVLWSDIRKAKKFVVIVMDAWEQAALMVEAIKAELEFNPRLAHDFPEFCGSGKRWREGEIITRSGMMILGAGARQKLRGRRFGPYRPDLVILDDIENDENVRSPEYRDKLESWVEKTIMKLGPPDGSMDLLIVGTVLHYDAVLVRMSRKIGFEVAHFRAIERFPDRMDFWEKWEEHLLNAGEAAALEFYARHKASMDVGAIINWPEVEPLYALMQERASSPSAFASEKQGEPLSEDSPFRVLPFWVIKNPRWIFFGALDPSLGRMGHVGGKSRRGDPSAILIGGFDRDSGILDVVESSICRRLPDVIIADVIALNKIYKPQLWFVEAVQFQEFLRTEIMKQAARHESPLSAVPVIPIADKALRIQRLQPPMAAGLVRVNANQTALIEQLHQWPNGAHDDGPDTLEMLWTGAVTYSGSMAIGGGAIMAARENGADTRGYV